MVSDPKPEETSPEAVYSQATRPSRAVERDQEDLQRRPGNSVPLWHGRTDVVHDRSRPQRTLLALLRARRRRSSARARTGRDVTRRPDGVLPAPVAGAPDPGSRWTVTLGLPPGKGTGPGCERGKPAPRAVDHAQRPQERSHGRRALRAPGARRCAVALARDAPFRRAPVRPRGETRARRGGGVAHGTDQPPARCDQVVRTSLAGEFVPA